MARTSASRGMFRACSSSMVTTGMFLLHAAVVPQRTREDPHAVQAQAAQALGRLVGPSKSSTHRGAWMLTTRWGLNTSIWVCKTTIQARTRAPGPASGGILARALAPVARGIGQPSRGC